MAVGKLRITYLVNHVAFFVSHRLPLAVNARRNGFEVELLVGQPGSPSMESEAVNILNNEQIPFERFSFSTSGTNLFVELIAIFKIASYLRKRKPEILHCASPKGVLYGALASRLIGLKNSVFAISGMGYSNTDSGRVDGKRALIGKLYEVIFKLVILKNQCIFIVQNKDDKAYIKGKYGIDESNIELIEGSGVQLELFSNIDLRQKEKIVLFPARILKDKGAQEFFEAARTLSRTCSEWQFIMAGAGDYRNPSAVDPETIMKWEKECNLKWLGHVDDMPRLMRKTAIVCLPSYREGMPKSLLEAAAAGCAIVTTDTIGCREAILPGITGELVPPRNTKALVDALSYLITNRKVRENYGVAGIKLASEKYSIDSVIRKTELVYDRLINRNNFPN